MADLTQAKTIGGIGAVLVLLSFVPTAGALFGIAGFVMVLVAIRYISQDLKDKKIFNDMAIAVVLAGVGLVVGSFIVLATVLSAFAGGYFGAGPAFAPSPNVTLAQWITFGTTIGLGLVGAWVFFLASAVFLRRTYKTMGSRLGVGTFGAAGTLYLLGAATAVVGIGFLLIFVAQILTAVAFWSIPAVHRPQPAIAISAPMGPQPAG